MREFEEIAEAQGWNENTQLELLRQYISNQQDDAALSDFAEDIALEENTDVDKTLSLVLSP
jgi:hypothetical protein